VTTELARKTGQGGKMNGVSKRIAKIVALAVVAGAIAVQPVLASAKTPERGSNLGSIIRQIIRVLDTIHISLPPG
jgi:hypothetical protein